MAINAIGLCDFCAKQMFHIQYHLVFTFISFHFISLKLLFCCYVSCKHTILLLLLLLFSNNFSMWLVHFLCACVCLRFSSSSSFHTIWFVCNEEYEWDSFHLRHIYIIFLISHLISSTCTRRLCRYDRIKIKNNINDILTERQEDGTPWMNHKPEAVWRPTIILMCAFFYYINIYRYYSNGFTWLFELTKSKHTNGENASIQPPLVGCFQLHTMIQFTCCVYGTVRVFSIYSIHFDRIVSKRRIRKYLL